MAISQTSGIVLKIQNWKETSRLVTLYTQDFGKIKAVAKGLKAKKGKGTGGLSQFSENEIVFYRKKSGLHLIDKWSFKDSNSNLYSNFKKLVIASIIAEMIDEYIEGEEKSPGLYRLLKRTLTLLAKDGHEELFLASFTVHFLKRLGYQPNFEKCCRCGKNKLSKPIFFLLNEGAVICQQCRTGKDRVVVVDEEMKAVVEYLQNIPPEKSIRLKLAPFFQKRLCNFLIFFLSYTLGKKLQSISLLETAVA